MQGRYFLLTIPYHEFTPWLPPTVQYIKGQLEQGSTTGFVHWQVLVAFKTKVRLAGVKNVFGEGIHCELSRSSAANDYVWKEDTRIEGTQFELGKLAFKRNSTNDWESLWSCAIEGRLGDIPADVR